MSSRRSTGWRGRGSTREDDYEVRLVCEWVANKNFLARRFSVARKDKVELVGTQIVGWDPSRQTIRSWSFDSDGSFNEGLWTKGQTLADSGERRAAPTAKKASASQVITKLADDKFTWQATNRSIGGVPQPNGDIVTMVRQQIQPAVTPVPTSRPVVTG